MNHDDIEPLEPVTWLLQLEKLVERIPLEEAALVTLLRRAFYLTQLTPRPLRHIIECSVSEREFEVLLESGALLPATVALVGERLDYSLTRLAADGGVEAEVGFPNDPASCRAIGASAPFALFTAWLQCLLTLDEPDLSGEGWARFPAQRKSQCEQHPKLTEH